MRLDAALEITEQQLASMDTSAWTGLVQRVIDDCHPEQRDFVLDPARRIVALVGRGGGKTTGGRARFVRRMLTQPGARCLYVAKIRQHAKDLMWEPIKARFKALGFVVGKDISYNETSLTVTVKRNGASLKLVGADKMADLEPLRGESFHEVGIDEAASHSDALLVHLIGSILGPRLLGPLWLIGTPGNRLKGLFYETSRRGTKRARLWKERAQFPDWKGWSLHKWTLKSAIDATADRPIDELVKIYLEQQRTIAEDQLSAENPMRRREYDGEWAADETVNVYRYRIHHPDTGELWNQWDPERIGPLKIAKLPEQFDDWVHVIALDLGFTDPTAFNVFATSPSDTSRTIYHRLCIERRGLGVQDTAKLLIGDDLKHEAPRGIIGAIGEWPNAMVADSAHQMAEAILTDLANVYGITIERAVKGFRYKLGAIEVVNGDLVDGRIKVLKDSELETQLLDLQWGETARGEPTEHKDQPNHSTDDLIYGRAALAAFMSALTLEGPPKPADPRAPGYVPPMPDEILNNEYAELMADVYGI